ncbi:LamG-like jellyroll fold domain-containing protein [Singulisphaera acidiphila]|uniref:FecR protein n=1 Tax=Singulisphaera acidiphila (strain ATCC BAA-1392 / DSM 18658 / VKM B-2454 / MOB10) TaxID=886293 RepID=L0DRI4_SINAD|nr:LamG-like jellyroll fold domain-containing protein [Singulisphaera acidiphila]AGA31610.1 FecR protein [Singulisphaera acidiphila DSM 18658]
MMREPDRDTELRTLLEALCEESITPEQMARLEAMMMADPGAEILYLEFMQIQSDLLREFGGARSGADLSGPDPGQSGVEDVLQPASSSLRLGGRLAPGKLLLLVAAAVIGLASPIAFHAFHAARARRAGPTGLGTISDSKPSYPKVDVTRGIALVVKLEGLQWESTDHAHPSEGDILAGGRLRFRSGRLFLSMFTGVSLVVEGPADVELLSFDKVHVRSGRLRARVPEGAEGFVVSGPGSAVVDLGTEFGLNIGSDGKMQGKVFKGRVEAALLNEVGTYRRSRMMDPKSHGFNIDPQAEVIDSGIQGDDFISLSRQATSPLVLDRRYRDAVIQARPWGYWRFDSLTDGLIPNEIPGHPSLRAEGPIHLSSPGTGNRSAVFEPGSTGQYLTVNGLWEPPRHPGYSVELWFLSQGISHAALVSLLEDSPTVQVNHSSELHFKFLLELTSRVRGKLHQPASLRLLHRFPTSYNGGDNLYSKSNYMPLQWHHLVGQLNEDRMELFLDGERTSPLHVDPVYSNRASQIILGRLTTLPKHNEDTSRPFVGWMDEVAIYNRPLTIEEIRGHYRLHPASRSRPGG